MLRTDLVKLPLEAVEQLFIKKLQAYVELFDLMDEHGGWYPYSDTILDYFDKLGVTHWADLYFPEGAEKWLKDRESQRKEAARVFADAIGHDAGPERVNEFLVDLSTSVNQALTNSPTNALPGLEFLESDMNATYVEGLSSEECQYQHDIWINQLVGLYNDLAIAAHGVSIFTLVARAIDHDNDALVKAIQIDPSLTTYFEKHLRRQSMKGNVYFLDSLSYRIKNPPRKGINKHPLLWILMKDLQTLRCLRRDVTSKQILNIYQDGVGDHPKYVIDDELTVQRQRRKFMKVYRQVK